MLGTFFLTSAFFISSILFLISLVISIININLNSKENFSKLLFFSFTLIILTTLNNTYFNKPIELNEYSNLSIWLNLFNWLPIFFISWGFRNYLIEKKQRILFSQYFLAGTIPLLISCILQLWFGFNNGPYSILNGLIVWFQYPIDGVGGLTGLFNNQNITGLWLSLALALSLGLIKESTNRLSRYSLIGIISLIIYFIYLTNSRNAFIGLLISIFISIGIKRSFLILISSSTFFYCTNLFYLLVNSNFNNKFLPIGLFSKISINYSFLEDRLIIWREALNLIFQRPLTGWGGSTFSYLFPKDQVGFEAFHTHNIFLELAYNFGIPLSIILILFTYNLVKKSIEKILNYNNKDQKIINSSWLLCFIIIIVTHNSDITFFDGRVSLICGIIISGLINIINNPLKIEHINK